MTFYVTLLDGSCSLVLGHNWLTRFNPLIDWVFGSISFRSFEQNISAPQSSSQQPPDLPPPADPTPPDPPPSFSQCKALPITIISAPAFALACCLQGPVQFSLQLRPAESDLRSTSTTSDDSYLSGIPPDYHNFANVFSKAKADILAPHREHDLKIDLEKGTSPPIGTTYSLSPSELESLQTFLDEHLAMGFIRPSSSAHAALVLFIRKKTGHSIFALTSEDSTRSQRKTTTPFPVSLTCWMFQAMPRSIPRLISSMLTIWSAFLLEMSGRPHSARAMALMNG